MSQNDPKNDKNQLSWSNPQNGGQIAGSNSQPQSQPSHKQEQKQEQKSAPKPVISAAPMNTGGERSAAKIAGWLAVGVVAGVIIAWGATSALKHGSPATTAGSLQNATSTSNGASATSTGLLTVASQKAGMAVAVSGVNVTAPTWVVVYESRNGTPGNVLGAQLFFPGTPWGNVDLLRGTVAGQTYFVTERKDNGDHQFSLTQDPLVLGADGQPSWSTFTAL